MHRISLRVVSDLRAFGRLTQSAGQHRYIATAESSFSLSNNERFDELLRAQKSGPIEKIVINCNKQSLLMNRNASTSHQCAKHVSSGVAANSALALVETEEGEQYKSVHALLTDKCTLHLIDYHNTQHAEAVNQAYWRSCAFVLGAAVSSAFSQPAMLIAAHGDDVSSGRFSYDVRLPSSVPSGWMPSSADLRSISHSLVGDLIAQSLPLECLSVPVEVASEFALEMDEGHADESGLVHLARIGSHVDVVSGPVIANTAQIGRFAIVQAAAQSGVMRFSGVSVPAAQSPSSYTWDLIKAAAKQ